MKKKILLAILLMVVLSCLAFIMILLEKYRASEEAMTKNYCEEIKDIMLLHTDEMVIKAVKQDLNDDAIEDYLLLIGKMNQNNSKLNKLADYNPDVETYYDVCLEFVNGKTQEVKRFDTEKSFNGNIKLAINADEENTYLLVSDNASGNVILNTLQNNEFVDILKNSFDTALNGYTFTIHWDENDQTKLKITLDNYGRSYLPENKQEYILDYESSEITKEVYRPSYMANKFSDMKLQDIDDDQILELVCVQNILYLNISSETLPKMLVSYKLSLK